MADAAPLSPGAPAQPVRTGVSGGESRGIRRVAGTEGAAIAPDPIDSVIRP